MTTLEFLRRKEGLSQAELAERLLYGRTTICRLESGELSKEFVHPRLSRSLEQYFGHSVSMLLAEVPDMTESVQPVLEAQANARSSG